MTTIELTAEHFKTTVVESPTPVLVDFWAPWCGPCKIMGPVLDEMAKNWSGKPLVIAKLNVDEHSKIAGQYGIMSIPTFLLFKGGAVVGQWRGVQEKKSWTKEIEAAL